MQVAAISSAAAASSSPLAPVSFTQNLSIGYHVIFVNTVKTVWRVLAGIAAGLGVGILLGVAVSQLRHRYDVCQCCNTKRSVVESDNSADVGTSNKNHEMDEKGTDNNATEDNYENEIVDDYNNCMCCSCDHPARNWGVGCGIFFGILVGAITATFYGLGSIIVPSVYDETVNRVYQDWQFDNFAVCRWVISISFSFAFPFTY